MRRHYPGLQTKDIRGNVDTRLRKLKAGEYDAILLAEAGLIRLGIVLPVERLDPYQFGARGQPGRHRHRGPGRLAGDWRPCDG